MERAFFQGCFDAWVPETAAARVDRGLESPFFTRDRGFQHQRDGKRILFNEHAATSSKAGAAAYANKIDSPDGSDTLRLVTRFAGRSGRVVVMAQRAVSATSRPRVLSACGGH